MRGTPWGGRLPVPDRPELIRRSRPGHHMAASAVAVARRTYEAMSNVRRIDLARRSARCSVQPPQDCTNDFGRHLVSEPTMDPTFYRSAAAAAAAPAEELAYVVAFDPAAQKHDAMTVVDVNPDSDTYGQVVGWADVPGVGDELHHFGWNACSSALKHEGHDMGGDGLQRRYLLLPGLRSSNIHVYDTQPDPKNPVLHKTIEAKELAEKAGYSRPHTLHCGPDGVFLTCLGGTGNGDGPGGIALLDHSTFDVLRAWETDRGPQYL